jgi:hypothetical protein
MGAEWAKFKREHPELVKRASCKPLQFCVSGRVLFCSRKLWAAMEGPIPQPDLFESDGCSNSPDVYRTWSGKRYKLWPACFVHDYHYRYLTALGTGALGRKRADYYLHQNIRTLVALQGGGKWDQRRISWLYWGRVRVWGATSWQSWIEGEKPLSVMARLKEAWWT